MKGDIEEIAMIELYARDDLQEWMSAANSCCRCRYQEGSRERKIRDGKQRTEV